MVPLIELIGVLPSLFSELWRANGKSKVAKEMQGWDTSDWRCFCFPILNEDPPPHMHSLLLERFDSIRHQRADGDGWSIHDRASRVRVQEVASVVPSEEEPLHQRITVAHHQIIASVQCPHFSV